jgi:hypothetical protein
MQRCPPVVNTTLAGYASRLDGAREHQREHHVTISLASRLTARAIKVIDIIIAISASTPSKPSSAWPSDCPCAGDQISE